MIKFLNIFYPNEEFIQQIIKNSTEFLIIGGLAIKFGKYLFKARKILSQLKFRTNYI